VAQKSTKPIALRNDCRTQKIKRFRFVALPEFIRALLLASQRPNTFHSQNLLTSTSAGTIDESL
jgi:hypothetical protein